MHTMWKKVLLAASMAAFAATAVMADDIPSFDSPSDGSVPSFGDESGALPGFGDADASSSSFGTASSSALEITGEGGAAARLFLAGSGDIEDRSVQMDPYFRLNFTYKGSVGDVEAKLKVNERILKDNPEDVIDELTLRAYLGDFVVEGGKMKLVWGKGDKVHVLDNFNSDDYSDFIFPDYIERRIAVPMIHVAYNGLMNARFEFAYSPYMTGTRYASSGPWVPERTLISAYKNANAMAKAKANSMGHTYSEPTLGAFLTSYGGSKATDLYGFSKHNLPDTRTLKYGQFGLRATGTVGSFDWGASYFYGRMKDSSIHTEELVKMLLNAGSSAHETVGQLYDYDRMQVFGLEGATVVGGFNFRAELGYFLTDDVDGDDPTVHNNSLQWVFGFDRDLPWNNLNFNIQTQGKYILHGDDVKKNIADVDYNGEKAWVQNRIILDITDSWMHEKLKPELKLVWNVEMKDVVVMPSVSYQLMEGLDVSLAGLYIYSGDNGQFADFKDNSFVQVGAVYKF